MHILNTVINHIFIYSEDSSSTADREQTQKNTVEYFVIEKLKPRAA